MCLLCGSTGWITHWGEPMANTSAAVMIRSLENILSYANDTGDTAAGRPSPAPCAWMQTDAVFLYLWPSQQARSLLVQQLCRLGGCSGPAV